MKYDYDLLVIGGGSGGLSITSAAAQIGVKVLLVDKEAFGGDCLHYGCVPSKSLLKSAKVAQYFRDAKHYGLTSLDPPIDWNTITDRISSIQGVIQDHDSAERFQCLGADTVYGTAKFIDKHTISIQLNKKLASGNKYDPDLKRVGEELIVSAKKIVIATGSSPNIIPFEGLASVGYITNEDIFTLKTQPKSLLIIGGGVIGVEMAQAFARLGTAVTMFLREEYILAREDPAISKVVQARLKKEGVRFIQHGQVQKFVKNKGKKQLQYKSQQKEMTADFDEVFVAIGRKPNLNLDLEKAGITYEKQGIAVNQKLQTNQKHIYAIGDVNGKMMFTHAANYEAGVVFMNAILGVPTKVNYKLIGYTIFTDPEVASIGLNETQAKKQGIKYDLIENTFATQDRALAEGETDGLIRILVDRSTRVLGCQMVSPRAGEMIREWQLIIKQRLKLSKVAQSTYIYPTFGEHSKWTAGKFLAPKLFNPTIKKILRMLKGYRGR